MITNKCHNFAGENINHQIITIMDIQNDVIKPIVESTFEDVLYHTESSNMDMHMVRMRIYQVLPLWSMKDMDAAINTGDFEKAKEILKVWEYLAESYASFHRQRLANRAARSPLPHDAQHEELRAKSGHVIQEIIKRIQELLYGSCLHFPENSPYYNLAKRLSEYTPGEGAPVAKTVKSIDDIVRPGQRLHISAITEDLMDHYIDSDVVIYWNDDASEWRWNWDNTTRSIFPMFPAKQTVSAPSFTDNWYRGKHGFFYEYNCDDSKKTRQRLDDYLAEGYGLKKRQKIIFVQENKHYFVCLGLCTLDEKDYENPPYGHAPSCFWYYPAFGLSEGFIEED